MNKFEILPLVERYYPLKLFVKLLVWTYCKSARLLFSKDSNSRNVLVVSLHRIGDSIFAAHAIKQIIRFADGKVISIVCFPETRDLYELLFPEIKLISIPHNYFWKGRIANKEAKNILYMISPEIIYDLTGAITSATLIASSSAKKIIGMNLEYFKPLYNQYVPIRTKPHLIDTYMDIVKLTLPVEKNVSFEFPFVHNRTTKILIHPQAGWKAKEWGIDKYIELADRLASQYVVEFIVEANSLNPTHKKNILEKFKLTETASVKELIDAIKSCSMLVGNDSGPIYIATILGKSTFTIYGPTNPEYSKPFGKHHQVIRKEIHCSPLDEQYCFADAGRKCPNFICMHSLHVDEVFEGLNSFIRKEETEML